MRGLRIYRRRLPHWRLDGATYFVTWRLHRGEAPLSPAERSLLLGVLRRFDGVRCQLHALVVMDDHVHVVVTPMAGWELGQIMHSWKSFSANRLQRTQERVGPVWQADSHDRIIRNTGELAQKIGYVRDNPMRRWPGTSHYPWVWIAPARDESGE
jgi:putative transposase